jgi:hypothetical protein
LKRREGFPSWSWTGWIGEIEWEFEEEIVKNMKPDSSMLLSLKLQDGQFISWLEFEQSYQELNPQLLGVLHVSGWITPVRINDVVLSKDHGYQLKALLATKYSSWREWEFEVASLEPLVPNSIAWALYLSRNVDSFEQITVMVVAETTPGVYQRIGLGYIETHTHLLGTMYAPLVKYWKKFELC